MVLSQDACATIDWFPEEMVAQLAPNWNFTHIFEDDHRPAARAAASSDADIDTMLDETPLRWLAGA